MHSPRLHKLKGLIGQYQLTNSPIVFEQILKRIDRFIVYEIRRFKQARYLCTVREEDLYQTAIIGAYEAVKIFPQNGRIEDIPDYLKSYMRRKVNLTYGYLKKEYSIPSIELLDNALISKRFISDPNVIFQKFELNDVLHVIYSLIKDDRITEYEMNILKDRLILHETYKEIAKKHNCSLGKVYKNYRALLLRLRSYCSHL